MQNWKTKKIKEFIVILLSIKDKDAMSNFLRDVATIEEIESLASRWEAAKLVHKGVSYRDVAKKTGLSTATVTRIAHWIKHGEGGYKEVLRRFK